jgi:acetyltransferase
MRLMIEWCQVEGLRVVEGQVLRENTAMLDMCARLGFEIRNDPDDTDIRIVTLPIGTMADAALPPA